eukprot:5021303-Lingulodinium_polyedra.AAC.1
MPPTRAGPHAPPAPAFAISLGEGVVEEEVEDKPSGQGSAEPDLSHLPQCIACSDPRKNARA